MPQAKKAVPAESGYDDSRFNATKHGITSAQAVFPWENSDEYKALHAETAVDLKPNGPIETRIVAEIADVFWRKQRLHKMETGAARFALGEIVWERFVPGRAPVARSEDIPEEQLAHLKYFMSIFAVEPQQAETMSVEVEAELADIAAARRRLLKHEDVDQVLGELSEPVREEYEDAHKRQSCTGDEKPLFTLIKILLDRKSELEYKRQFLGIYREVHDAALYEVAVGPIYDKIARYETHLDRKLERAFKILLAIKSFKRCAVTIDAD